MGHGIREKPQFSFYALLYYPNLFDVCICFNFQKKKISFVFLLSNLDCAP